MNKLSTVPPIVTPEIEVAKTNANTLMIATKKFAESAKALVIITDADAGVAADLGKDIATTKKDLEEIRTGIVSPHNDFVKSVNAFFKPTTASLDASRAIVDGKYVAFNAKRRAEAEARAAAERKAQEEAAAKLAADLEKDGQSEVAEAVLDQQIAATAAAAPAKAAPIYTVAGTTGSVAQIPDFEVIDIEKVPSAYVIPKQVDAAAVRKAISGKEGLRDIPGLRIFMKDRPRFG